MIKDNQQHFNRLHVIIDAFVHCGIIYPGMVAEVFERYFGLTGWCTVIWILHEGTGRDCSVVSDFVLCV